METRHFHLIVERQKGTARSCRGRPAGSTHCLLAGEQREEGQWLEGRAAAQTQASGKGFALSWDECLWDQERGPVGWGYRAQRRGFCWLALVFYGHDDTGSVSGRYRLEPTLAAGMNCHWPEEWLGCTGGKRKQKIGLGSKQKVPQLSALKCPFASRWLSGGEPSCQCRDRFPSLGW